MDLSLFQKVLTDPLILDGSDFIEIWRSAVKAKMGVKNGQKYRVFEQDFEKTTFQT